MMDEDIIDKIDRLAISALSSYVNAPTYSCGCGCDVPEVLRHDHEEVCSRTFYRCPACAAAASHKYGYDTTLCNAAAGIASSVLLVHTFFPYEKISNYTTKYSRMFDEMSRLFLPSNVVHAMTYTPVFIDKGDLVHHMQHCPAWHTAVPEAGDCFTLHRFHHYALYERMTRHHLYWDDKRCERARMMMAIGIPSCESDRANFELNRCQKSHDFGCDDNSTIVTGVPCNIPVPECDGTWMCALMTMHAPLTYQYYDRLLLISSENSEYLKLKSKSEQVQMNRYDSMMNRVLCCRYDVPTEVVLSAEAMEVYNRCLIAPDPLILDDRGHVTSESPSRGCVDHDDTLKLINTADLFQWQSSPIGYTVHCPLCHSDLMMPNSAVRCLPSHICTSTQVVLVMPVAHAEDDLFLNVFSKQTLSVNSLYMDGLLYDDDGAKRRKRFCKRLSVDNDTRHDVCGGYSYDFFDVYE